MAREEEIREFCISEAVKLFNLIPIRETPYEEVLKTAHAFECFIRGTPTISAIKKLVDSFSTWEE